MIMITCCCAHASEKARSVNHTYYYAHVSEKARSANHTYDYAHVSEKARSVNHTYDYAHVSEKAWRGMQDGWALVRNYGVTQDAVRARMCGKHQNECNEHREESKHGWASYR